jgi:hypothetical protein
MPLFLIERNFAEQADVVIEVGSEVRPEAFMQ